MCRTNLPEFLNGAKTEQIDVAHARPKLRRDLVGEPLIEIPQADHETVPGIQIADGLHERLPVRGLRQPLFQAAIGNQLLAQIRIKLVLVSLWQVERIGQMALFALGAAEPRRTGGG